jgi:hypothetical protein
MGLDLRHVVPSFKNDGVEEFDYFLYQFKSHKS